MNYAEQHTDRQEVWQEIVGYISKRFGKKPDLNAILFIIGMRELGMIQEKPFRKDDKVSLMHIATCKILSYSGHYKLNGTDQDGWPVWEMVKPVPDMAVLQQESYIREHIIEYFINEHIL